MVSCRALLLPFGKFLNILIGVSRASIDVTRVNTSERALFVRTIAFHVESPMKNMIIGATLRYCDRFATS